LEHIVLKPNPSWTTSSESAGGNCVEVTLDPATSTVKVRNSKDRQGPVLTFTKAEWTAFIGGAKGGEFDL